MICRSATTPTRISKHFYVTKRGVVLVTPDMLRAFLVPRVS